VSLRERIEHLKSALSGFGDIPTSPLTFLRSHPSSPLAARSPHSSTPRTRSPSGRRISDRSSRSVDPHVSPDPEVEFGYSPRLVSSLDSDVNDTPTSALREGIEDAKQTVHDMGDVLDTPRTAPVLRSPGSRQAENKSIASWGRSRSPSNAQEKGDKSSQDDLRTSTSIVRSPAAILTPHPNVKIVETNLFDDAFSLPPRLPGNKADNSLDSRGDPEDLSENSGILPPDVSPLQPPIQLSESSKEQLPGNKGPNELDSWASETADGLPKIKSASPGKEEVQNISQSSGLVGYSDDLSKDEKLSITTLPSNNATLNETMPLAEIHPRETSVMPKSPVSAGSAEFETRKHRQSESDLSEHEADVSSSSSSDDGSTPSIVEKVSSDGAKEKGVCPEVVTERELPEEAQAQVFYDNGIKADAPGRHVHGQTLPATKSLSPAQSTHAIKRQIPPDSVSPASTADEMPASPLPDDLPTLIKEVARAREEARKWQEKVTQTDRDKRELGRRLVERESELARLQNVENK